MVDFGLLRTKSKIHNYSPAPACEYSERAQHVIVRWPPRMGVQIPSLSDMRQRPMQMLNQSSSALDAPGREV
jgi:hypothetical protein